MNTIAQPSKDFYKRNHKVNADYRQIAAEKQYPLLAKGIKFETGTGMSLEKLING